MLHLVLLLISPLLVGASGIAEWQLPLNKHPGGAKCGRGRKGLHYGSAFSIFLNGDWRYYFSDYFPDDSKCNQGERTLLDMRALDEISNRLAPKPPLGTTSIKRKKPRLYNRPVSLLLTIPQGTEEEGPLIVEPDPAWKLFHEWDLSVDIKWTDSKVPGRALNITSIGVRQGATSTSKTSKVSFALGTPYINIPNDMFDVLALAAKPNRTEMGRNMKPIETVDCAAIGSFPNIVLDFDDGAFELLVKPEQYVLRVNEALGGLFKGKCVLLVARGGDISIGWAALRGMSLWLDWQNQRTGFATPRR